MMTNFFQVFLSIPGNLQLNTVKSGFDISPYFFKYQICLQKPDDQIQNLLHKLSQFYTISQFYVVFTADKQNHKIKGFATTATPCTNCRCFFLTTQHCWICVLGVGCFCWRRIFNNFQTRQLLPFMINYCHLILRFYEIIAIFIKFNEFIITYRKASILW